MGKWKLIEEVLRKYGYNELAEKAKEIKELLVRIYGSEETEYWKRYGKKWREFLLSGSKNPVKLATMLELVACQYPCKACEETMKRTDMFWCVNEQFCGKCEFGKEAGKCYEENSMWYKFWKELSSLKEIKNAERFSLDEIEDMIFSEDYKGWVILGVFYRLKSYIAIKEDKVIEEIEYNNIRRKIDEVIYNG